MNTGFKKAVSFRGAWRFEGVRITALFVPQHEVIKLQSKWPMHDRRRPPPLDTASRGYMARYYGPTALTTFQENENARCIYS